MILTDIIRLSLWGANVDLVYIYKCCIIDLSYDAAEKMIEAGQYIFISSGIVELSMEKFYNLEFTNCNYNEKRIGPVPKY